MRLEVVARGARGEKPSNHRVVWKVWRMDRCAVCMCTSLSIWVSQVSWCCKQL